MHIVSTSALIHGMRRSELAGDVLDMHDRASSLWAMREAARARVNRGFHYRPHSDAPVTAHVDAWVASHTPIPKRPRYGADAIHTPMGLMYGGLPSSSAPVPPAIIILSHAIYSLALNSPNHWLFSVIVILCAPLQLSPCPVCGQRFF